MCNGFLHDCTYHYGNRFDLFTEPVDEVESFETNFPHMYYRFHRYIPRRRLWMW